MGAQNTCSGTIAVDIMGGDKGPEEILRGICLALKNDPSLEGIVAVGADDVLDRFLAGEGKAYEGRLSVLKTSQVVDMNDKAGDAVKKKRDSSMMQAIDLVKSGNARAVLSCGNTGALMAGGTIKLRPLAGVERPAIATVIPCKGGHYVLLDSGANPDPDPEHLVHNAILGSNYAEWGLEVENPRVGLLTIGTEEGKGNERTIATHALLKQLDGVINYRGLIEGFQVYGGEVDVVVADGFVGNILLKTSESLYKFLIEEIKAEVASSSWMRKLGALMMKGVFVDLKKRLSPEQYGGAPFLGLKGNVLKSHGSSNRFAIASAIRIGVDLARRDMIGHTHDDIEQANKILELS